MYDGKNSFLCSYCLTVIKFLFKIGNIFWYLLFLQWQMRVTARTLTSSVLMNSSGLHLWLHHWRILVALRVMLQIIHQYVEFQTNVELPFHVTLRLVASRGYQKLCKIGFANLDKLYLWCNHDCFKWPWIIAVSFVCQRFFIWILNSFFPDSKFCKFISSWRIFFNFILFNIPQTGIYCSTVWMFFSYISQPDDTLSFLNSSAWKMGNLLQTFHEEEKNVFH